MRWAAIGLLALLAGCTTTRQITITATPPDSSITIDGVNHGPGPVQQTFTFKSANDVHTVTASRMGYAPLTVDVTRSFDRPDLLLALEPRKRDVTIHVVPVAGNVLIDGKQQGDGPIRDLPVTLSFTTDDQNQWTEHTVQVSRPGYQSAQQVIRWADPSPDYTLTLGPLRKDVLITTTPPGAQVSINGQSLGKSPAHAHNFAFPVDPKTDKFLPQTMTVSKPGYDLVQTSLSWDNGRQNYHVDLAPKSKVVQITTDPPGATVTIDGQELKRGENGVSTATLSFPPVDESGTLRTYNAVVTKKTADTEWIPEELTIGWDNQKRDYSVHLEEVKTRPVWLIRPKTIRTDEGWQIEPETIQTLAMKDVTEGPAAEPPVRITDLPRGSIIDTLAVSPDGQWLLFTTLTGKTRVDFRSQIQVIHADGTGGPALFGDGHSLDLNPTYTPDGSQIVFASNRGGRHLSVWQMAASGEGGVTQLTAGDTSDLWPTVDSAPRPRLFYEALVDSRPDPRIYMTQLGTTLRTDLTQSGGEQPRVSPKADSVVFTLLNSKTQKRDIYRMPDRGGGAVNLTNSSQFDNFDPAWSQDGSKIAFVSDRGVDSDGRHNFDIYVLDLLHPDKPNRITTNGSWDDCPVWDPSGKYIYFRSNRGGSWAIWRAAVK